MARYWLRSAVSAVVAASAGIASAQSPAALSSGSPPAPSAIAIPDVVPANPAPITRTGYQPDPTAGTTARQDLTPVQATQPIGDAPRSTGGEAGTSQVQASSPTNQSINANDAGDLLAQSAQSTGVRVQKRNQIVADPRVRGYRSGQYITYADGGLFVPARSDLDTPISKYDPASIRDVIVVRGPYSALYGPALAVLDVATLDSPRAMNGCGTEWHTRSFGGYQTNGESIDLLTAVSAAGPDWGIRATYNYLQGNDYEAGDGTRIPASYLSNNVNVALGFDLSPDVSFELKALKVLQNALEYPGLYFDAFTMDTEAYSARLTARHFGPFDRATTDVWYNSTAGTGNTVKTAKQQFVDQLLFVSFNQPRRGQIPGGPGFPLATFTDQSNSRFASRSIGYRLTGMIGDEAGANVKVGTDLSVVGQGLAEQIRITQLTGFSQINGLPVTSPQLLSQNTGIPSSNVVNPGLFLQGTAPVTERWKMTAGGRVDAAFASSNPRLITGNFEVFGPALNPSGATVSIDPIIYSANPTDPQLSRQYLLLAGFLASEYKIDQYVTAAVAVGHAERPPTLTELYATGPFIGVLQQGTSRLIGDPNISPEKLTQFDVGLKADYGWVRAAATGFYAFVHDYITYDANKLSTNGGLTQVVFTNTDLATLAGVELYGEATVTARVTLFGTMSYVQGIDQTHSDVRRQANLQSSRRNNPSTRDFAASTEPLPQIPPLDSRIGFRVHQAAELPRWQIETSARMVAGQNSVATSLGELPTPGFTVFDVRGYWQATDRLLLTAGVENFGDRLFREHLDPIAGNLIGFPFYRRGTNFYFTSQFTY